MSETQQITPPKQHARSPFAAIIPARLQTLCQSLAPNVCKRFRILSLP
jgi:hypothetical protein